MAKIERTRNASRNIVFGIMLKIYQIFIPFLMRTAMIYLMGIQYLGLNSLFTSILSVLNLAELGVGSAMVYSMYKPIAEDNHDSICALMKLYRTYYRIIGAVIACVGIAVTPFIPKLINGTIPDNINIYGLYLLNLGATVLSYWLFAYKNSILQAYQRNDVRSKVTLVTNTVQYGFQIWVLWEFYNYYYYVIVMLATQALTNIITAICANMLYPQYSPKGHLPDAEVKQINQRIRDLFTAKIGSVVVNSADTIVISSFLGLAVLAVYQNYYYILTAIIGFVSVVFTSVMAGIGNSIIVESKEKNFIDLKRFTFIISWVAGVCTCCLLVLYQPFMEIWVGKDLMLDFYAVVCLCVYYFIYEINQLLNTYKDAAGIWHEDRFRPLITAGVNLGLNIIMVQFCGIYGVLLSTVISTIFVGMPWLLHNIFTMLFDRKNLKEYLQKLLLYIFSVGVTCTIVYVACIPINIGKWPSLILKTMICLVAPNAIFVLLFHNQDEFIESLKLLNKLLNGKISFICDRMVGKHENH